jgi:hypothetical protein
LLSAKAPLSGDFAAKGRRAQNDNEKQIPHHHPTVRKGGAPGSFARTRDAGEFSRDDSGGGERLERCAATIRSAIQIPDGGATNTER